MARCPRTIPLRRFTPACLLLLLATLACQTSPTGNAAPATRTPANTREPRRGASALVRDLSQDQAAGGHELRQRLRRERNISAASTWTDRQTAEQAIGAALEHNRETIDHWLNRPGGHPNLVIDYAGDPSHPIGRSLRRDADQPEPCSHATVVLKWTGDKDYYVLTSYPECRA